MARTPAPTDGVRRRNYGKGHGYRVDGEKWPGVTTLTGRMPKDAIARWNGRVVAEKAVDNWYQLGKLPISKRLASLMSAPFDEKDAATNRGTEVHRLGVELITTGRAEGVAEELRPYVEQYADAVRTLDMQPMLAEFGVINRDMRYCGSGDLIAALGPVPYLGDVIPADSWLIDVKTGAKAGVWPETAVQVCGYACATATVDFSTGTETGDVARFGKLRRGALQVRPDGWDLVLLDDGAEIEEYLAHLAACYWLTRDDADREWVGAAAGPFVTPPARR